MDAAFEVAVLPIDASVLVEDHVVEPGSLGLITPGRETLRLSTTGADTRLMVLGGEPLGERIQMWWNFVARTRAEITDAWTAWEGRDADRFGPVPSRLPRMDAPTPPWIRPPD
ncbi:hypothetical protein BH23ACT5_BH23ACT5_21970 [soil metagenome]